MNYVAMDVSKDEIVFYDTVSESHHTVSNTSEEIEKFIQEQKYDLEDTIVGCESTADYHLQACITWLKSGYEVKVLNPIVTKQIINATVRKKKTDYTDAEIIAKLLKDGNGQKVSFDSFNQEKRTILRTEQKLIKQMADLKRLQKSLQVKEKSMKVDECMEAVEKCIKFLDNEAKKLTKCATKTQNEQEEIIDSVPGCGIKLAAIISAEAGDIKRFPSSSQFKAFVGIDPRVIQSGNKLYTGSMTKRGNSILRHAMFLAANVARQHDPDLKAFYQKKRDEGKTHRHAVCTISRKLCERIYAIVSKNEFYQMKS